MNGCEYYQELISRLIDGELSDEGKAVLAQHLRDCAECAALFDAFSGVSQAIWEDMEEAPAHIAENVMAHVRRSGIVEKNTDSRRASNSRHKATGKKKTMPGAVKVLLSAAACLALVIAAAYTLPAFDGLGMMKAESPMAAPAAPAASEPRDANIDAAAGLTGTAEYEQAAAPMHGLTDNAPMEASVEEGEAESAVSISNVYKIEILYAGELVEDFTLHVGAAPIRLTGKIYPISVEDSPQWRSSDESIITVTPGDDGSCIVEAVGSGSAKVLAEYGGKTGECWVRAIADTSAPPAEGLEIQYAGSKIYEFTLHVGDANIPLKGMVDTEKLSGNISWSSTDEGVIVVHDTDDGWCAVEAVGEGSASVVLECDGMQVRCKVYVVEKPKAE